MNPVLGLRQSTRQSTYPDTRIIQGFLVVRNHFLSPKRNHSPHLWQKGHGSTSILPWFQIKAHAGLRSPKSPPTSTCFTFQPLALPSWHCSLPQASLPPDTLYNAKDPLPPHLSSLLLQIALARSGWLGFFLFVLNSSRCLWIFSFSYLQQKPSP